MAPWRGEKAELMSGKGFLFFTVMLFSPRKSLHGLSKPAFFLTKKKTSPTGEEECLTSCSQGTLDVPFHSLLLRARVVIQPATGERSSRLEVDGAVIQPMRRQQQGGVLVEHGS